MSFTRNICKNMSLSFYGIFIIVNFISYLEEPAFDFRNIYAVVFFLILCSMNFILSRRKHIQYNTRKILYGYLIVFLIALVHAQFVSYASYIYLEILSCLFFVLDLFLLLRVIIITNCFKEFISMTALIFNAFMMILFAVFFDGMGASSLLLNAFSGLDRYRNTYGLYHANQTGNLVLFTMLINLYFLIVVLKKKVFLRLGVATISLVELYMLLTTASRNAILSLAFFLITFSILYYYDKFESKSKIFVFINIVVIAMFVLLNVDMKYLIGLSLRGENFAGNIPNLKTVWDWIFGLGLVGSGYFKLGFSSYYRTTFIDNYLLYVLMTSGLIGCILIFVPYYKIIKLLFAKEFSEKNLKHFLCSMSIMILFSAMFETNLLYPQFVSSFVYWLVIFYHSQVSAISQ